MCMWIVSKARSPLALSLRGYEVWFHEFRLELLWYTAGTDEQRQTRIVVESNEIQSDTKFINYSRFTDFFYDSLSRIRMWNLCGVVSTLAEHEHTCILPKWGVPKSTSIVRYKRQGIRCCLRLDSIDIGRFAGDPSRLNLRRNLWHFFF